MHPDILRARSVVVRAMRDWFHTQGYLEVHTPLLVPSGAMEATLHPVAVGELQLHTSPELAMKRVVSEGLCRTYQMVPCFREEERGRHHSREFTMVEWYRVGAGTSELMDEVESLIETAARALQRSLDPWVRVAVADLIEDSGDPSVWFETWVDHVEPKLLKPTIVHGYPAWQAALALIRDGLADRFEVYLAGIELANAFAEETSSGVLRERLLETNRIRAAEGRPPHPVDEAFLAAVDCMPRCAGIALGLDRLLMALVGATDIEQVQVTR